MPVSVTLPALGESVTEGTVTRWLKQEGDTVEADEPLLEVSTDKVDTEIPAPASGVLLQIKVREDETVDVGAELAVIGEASDGIDGGGIASAEPAEAEQPAAVPEQPAPATPAASPAPATVAAAPAASTPDTLSSSGSTVSVTLPALGESVTEGTVTRWLKQEGDPVQADEPLLEISTDKVDTEIPAPASGVLLKIKVAADETAGVGTELAVIGSAAGPPASSADVPAPAAAPTVLPAQQPPAQQPPTQQPFVPERPVSGDGASYVTPLVRKLAAEHGVDLGNLSGTGVGGRIRKQDVLDAAKAAKAAADRAQPAQAAAPATAGQAPVAASPLRGRTEKMSRLRQVIAARMVESLHISAQLTTVVEVDVTKIARLRDRVKRDFEAREGVKLSFLPFFALAAVEALKQHPNVNAVVDTEKSEVTYHAAEHLGVAVDTERGLLVPVIRNAGDLNLAGLARKIADLAARTRDNKVMPDELSGGTFTLTNTGSRGALFDTPIINQPQVAILGTGSVVKRPVVVDDPDLGETIAIRSMVYLALTYDHRIIDGADAARFLATLKQRLEGGAFEV